MIQKKYIGKFFLFTAIVIFNLGGIFIQNTFAATPLTANGIIEATNVQRAQRNLQKLKTDPILNTLAQKRVTDMFKRQYFAHENPDGKKVGDNAKEEGYFYRVIGENLAFGDFENNQDVVNAWMASLGHRANILDTRFSRIGLAVGYGIFAGELLQTPQNVWIVAQVFTKPASDCPESLLSLAGEIQTNRVYAAQISKIINTYKGQAETLRRSTTPQSRQFIKLFNQFSAIFDTFTQSLNTEITLYNKQVTHFEDCAKI